MRRCLELIPMGATALALLATGAVPTSDCAAESVVLQAATTCGPAGPVTLTTKGDCTVVVNGPGSGLPANGHLTAARLDAGVKDGFLLDEFLADGGSTQCATGEVDAGALTIRCGRNCRVFTNADGGVEHSCASQCEGVLNP